MQPDYTFALKVKENLSQVQERFVKALAYLATPGCLLYALQQPTRLLALADELSTLTVLAPTLSPAQVLADVITSNINRARNLSATTRGPYRLCGKTVHFLVTQGRLNAGSTFTRRLMCNCHKNHIDVRQLADCCCCCYVILHTSVPHHRRARWQTASNSWELLM
jgi:hypothetical protein